MHAERFLQKAAKKTKVVMALRVLPRLRLVLIVSIRTLIGAPGSRAPTLPDSPGNVCSEMLRDLPGLFHFDFFDRGIQLVVRFPTLRRAAHVSGGMRQRNFRLGHAD